MGACGCSKIRHLAATLACERSVYAWGAPEQRATSMMTQPFSLDTLAILTARPTAPTPNTATLVPGCTWAVLYTAPQPVDTPARE